MGAFIDLGGLRPSLAAILIAQRQRENHLLTFFLAGVRSIPPIANACLQISAFLAICWLSKCVDSTARSHSFEKIAIGSVDSCDC